MKGYTNKIIDQLGSFVKRIQSRGDSTVVDDPDMLLSSKMTASARSKQVDCPELDPVLVDVFCKTFGEEYRGKLTLETDMDAVEGWDSQSYLGFVLELEEAYGVTFSDSEAAQMFQLGHVQRVISNAKLDLPHDDVSHACCQIQLLGKASAEELKLIVLSGSSTREGFVEPAKGLELLRRLAGRDDASWYNISVSGLVAAETLQLLEAIKPLKNAILLIGWSPIILAGCGQAEFKRSATHSRFPFAARKMDRILKDNGYAVKPDEMNPSIAVDVWVERYLKGRSIEEMHYAPYLYPTLAPWNEEKYSDEESIVRFYNNALLNYENSINVNELLYREMLSHCQQRGITVGFLELTLHSKMRDYLENLGEVISRTDTVLAKIQADTQIRLIDAPAQAGIVDEDFRDPAHIFRKREAYNKKAIQGALDMARDASA